MIYLLYYLLITFLERWYKMTNSIKVLNDIDEFIKFIIDLFNDEFSFCIEGLDAFYYFVGGGCYELAQIIKRYFPNSSYVVNKEYNHCAILYNGVIYDAYSAISYDEYIKRFGENARPEIYYKQIEDFNEYSKTEIDSFEVPFGKNIKCEGTPIMLALINELDKIDSVRIGNN